MTRPPLDLFIIESNALDTFAIEGHNLPGIVTQTTEVWDRISEDQRQSIRDLYQPGYERVIAAYLNSLVNTVNDMEDGSVVDIYRTEITAFLRAQTDPKP